MRINPLTTPDAMHDLAAVVAGKPAGILLPKADGPADVLRLSYCLDALEAREGIAPGSIKIIPVATETARAPFSLGAYADAGLKRLYGLTWGAEDLSAAVGASSNTDEDGQLSLTYRTVRSLMLLAAKACERRGDRHRVPGFPQHRCACAAIAIASRREGFTARFAIHPDQVDAINEAFSPGAEEVAFAERVVAAFAATDAGAVGVDGKMLDRPHLVQAQKVLARRDAFAGRS